MPRMTILHAAERQVYEMPPILDAAQRSGTFDVPAGLLDMAKALRKPAHQIGFLVSCAYFGLAKRFFAPKDYHARDIRHAAHQLELRAAFTAADYPARTRQRHEQLILQFYGYRPGLTHETHLVLIPGGNRLYPLGAPTGRTKALQVVVSSAPARA